MKNILIIFLLTNLIASCNAQNTNNSEYVYSEDDSVSGQIHTAERLKLFMDKKQYEEAIDLFSLDQQTDIREIQKDEEIFKCWCNAWTFDSVKFEIYVSMIKERKAHFIFENDEWKINEK